MPQATPYVTLEARGSVALITIDRPPVNAIGYEVRRGLLDAFEAVEQDAALRAVVVACAGRTFIAGADITEFGAPPRAPILGDLISRIEDCDRPVVAALHGTALGGGFEVALGCHYRVAAATARFGLPEVRLGIIPGAGGTQRLPRIVGVARAIDIITGCEPLDAGAALAAGLIDRIADGALVDDAIAFAQELIKEGLGPRRVRDRNDMLAPAHGNAACLAEARRKFAPGAHGAPAPLLAIDAIEAATQLPFDEGLRRERETTETLKRSFQSKARRYLFFAERQAAKAPARLAVSDTAGDRLLRLRSRDGDALVEPGLLRRLGSLLHDHPFPCAPCFDEHGQAGAQAEALDLAIHAIINDAARILEEDAASRASDIDVGWVRHGWPVHLGGPTYYADALGLAAVRDRLRQLRHGHGDAFKPAALIERLADQGGTFGDLSR